MVKQIKTFPCTKQNLAAVRSTIHLVAHTINLKLYLSGILGKGQVTEQLRSEKHIEQSVENLSDHPNLI